MDDDFFGESTQPTETTQPPQESPMDDPFGEEPEQPQEIPQEAEQQQIESQEEVEEQQPLDTQPPEVYEQETPDPFSQSEPAAPEIPELSPLQKWEIENRQDMETRDQNASAQLQTMKEEAVQSIQQYYTERDAGIAANHTRNTENEETFCSSRDALFAHGDVWARVVSLIDLKGTNEKQQKRVARMRQLLLQLKNEPRQ
eukprot:NODE_320_length_952_cov_343.745455_g313_i0.p1 GENE.NODE_320_length_952_cov_343.745455_g313_i0~~NODE_320_length_952_cov_343.745455_g313_i0.p1  ORF type:complete len:200 (-),score=56.32 NODE_320_length_952_cov_343.745455_g313_i0:291-890(-)